MTADAAQPDREREAAERIRANRDASGMMHEALLAAVAGDDKKASELLQIAVAYSDDRQFDSDDG